MGLFRKKINQNFLKMKDFFTSLYINFTQIDQFNFTTLNKANSNYINPIMNLIYLGYLSFSKIMHNTKMTNSNNFFENINLDDLENLLKNIKNLYEKTIYPLYKFIESFQIPNKNEQAYKEQNIENTIRENLFLLNITIFYIHL